MFFGDEVQSIKVSCVFRTTQYDCELSEVYYTTDNGAFEVTATWWFLDNKNDVYAVTAVNSVINYFPLQILDTFGNLVDLILINVKLKELKTLRSCEKLQTINVCDNELASVGKVFDACKNLLNIYMDNNLIVSIDSGSFAKLSMLKTVYMPHNQLEVIPDGLFDGNLKLSELDV